MKGKGIANNIQDENALPNMGDNVISIRWALSQVSVEEFREKRRKVDELVQNSLRLHCRMGDFLN